METPLLPVTPPPAPTITEEVQWGVVVEQEPILAELSPILGSLERSFGLNQRPEMPLQEPSYLLGLDQTPLTQDLERVLGLNQLPGMPIPEPQYLLGVGPNPSMQDPLNQWQTQAVTQESLNLWQTQAAAYSSPVLVPLVALSDLSLKKKLEISLKRKRAAAVSAQSKSQKLPTALAAPVAASQAAALTTTTAAAMPLWGAGVCAGAGAFNTTGRMHATRATTAAARKKTRGSGRTASSCVNSLGSSAAPKVFLQSAHPIQTQRNASASTAMTTTTTMTIPTMIIDPNATTSLVCGGKLSTFEYIRETYEALIDPLYLTPFSGSIGLTSHKVKAHIAKMVFLDTAQDEWVRRMQGGKALSVEDLSKIVCKSLVQTGICKL